MIFKFYFIFFEKELSMFRFNSLGPHLSGGYKAMNIVLDEDP